MYGCGIPNCFHDSRRKALECTRRLGNVNAHTKVKSLEDRLNHESELTETARGTVEKQDEIIQSLEASIKTLQAREEILKLSLDQLEQFKAALQFCSGSADFQDGGVAREGWLKLCAPLLV